MITVFAALSAFTVAQEADGLTEKTRVWYTVMLKDYKTRYGATPIDQITTESLRQYVIDVRRAAKSATTATDKITALHRFYSWASGEYSIANPMARIKRPTRPEPQVKAPTIEHVRQLLSAVDLLTPIGIRDLALLTLVIDTCLRISEALDLRTDDFDFADHTLTVRAGKFGKRRVVPFTRECEGVILRWLKYRPKQAEGAKGGASAASDDYVFLTVTANRPPERLTYPGARQMLRRLHKKAGLDTFVSWHKYRHFGAQQYRRQGADPLNLQKLLGHADVGTTLKHYGNWQSEELTEDHERYSALNVLSDQKGI